MFLGALLMVYDEELWSEKVLEAILGGFISYFPLLSICYNIGNRFCFRTTYWETLLQKCNIRYQKRLRCQKPLSFLYFRRKKKGYNVGYWSNLRRFPKGGATFCNTKRNDIGSWKN